MKQISMLLAACLFLGGCTRAPTTEVESSDGKPSRRETEELLRHARALAANADYTRAEQYLNLAAQSGRDESEVTPLLIDVCIKDQRYRAALQYAEEHLRRHPRAYRLRFIEATLLSALGDVARARVELEKVLSVKPTHADAHYSLAILLRDDLGDHSEADHHFRRYLALEPQGVHAEEAGQSLLEAMP
jgi:tetratricopeptide (TPR) repeat protein